MSLRPEPAVQYKRLIKRTLVSALKTVFSEDYPDPQLKNLYVSTGFPLKREQFPGIIVDYRENNVKSAGVAQIEYLESESFLTVPAKHFMFDGSIQLKCVALSPLDIDILTDSVVELLGFGRLDSLLNKFFEKVYDDVADSAQIAFRSDYLTPLGDTTMSTMWNSEDALIYQSGYAVGCFGGFYNTIKELDVTNYIEDIIVYGGQPFEREQEKLLEIVGSNTVNPFYVRGRSIISST